MKTNPVKRERTLRALSKADYARATRLATAHANEHTVYSSKDWQAIWSLIFMAFKAGYHAAARKKERK